MSSAALLLEMVYYCTTTIPCPRVPSVCFFCGQSSSSICSQMAIQARRNLMFDTLLFAHSLDTHYSPRSFAAHAPHTRLRDSSADSP